MALGFEALSGNRLADVFLQMSEDYTTFGGQLDGYSAMYNRLYWSMFGDNSTSSLKSLPAADKLRLMYFLNVFWTAKKGDIVAKPLNTQYVKLTLDSGAFADCHYCRNDNVVLNWLLLSSLYPKTSTTHSSILYNTNHHGHGRDTKPNDIQLLIGIILALVLATIALIAFVYLTSKMLDAFERFYYGEDADRAFWTLSVTFAASILTSIIAGMLLLPVLTTPLLLALATLSFGVIAAAATAFLADTFYVNFLANGEDAIDPSDPERFSLTREQMINLNKQGFDIFSVDCAILALRQKIGEKSVPTYLKRMFWNTEAHKVISELHQLKMGKLETLEVDGMKFELKTAKQRFATFASVTPFIPPEPTLSIDDYNSHNKSHGSYSCETRHYMWP